MAAIPRGTWLTKAFREHFADAEAMRDEGLPDLIVGPGLPAEGRYIGAWNQ
jgi:hypothetical protein